MRIVLKHREASSTAQGILCAMNPEHIALARESWLEDFTRRFHAAKRDEDLILWERGFMSAALPASEPPPVGHVVLSAGRIEGIVVTAPEPQPSRAEAGASLVYVRYLATAPWNRDGSIHESGCRGIGRLLVARAVLDSIARGHDGRIGLHAFRGAGPFYDSLGFDCHGADPVHRGMAFHELPPRSAVRVLAELGAQLVHNPEYF